MEKALRDRCAEVHLDERRLPSSPLAAHFALGIPAPRALSPRGGAENDSRTDTHKFMKGLKFWV